MEAQETDSTSWRSSAGYKRASRKGAPRRFKCDHEGCSKMYSRFEHLQRHQLNHNPTSIFVCDMDGCEQRFVRGDLLARHKKRHSASYIPRNRPSSFSSSKASPQASGVAALSSSGAVAEPRSGYGRAPHDAAILLDPDPSAHQGQSSRVTQALSWPATVLDVSATDNNVRPKPNYYHQGTGTLSPEHLAFGGVSFASEDITRTVNENFGTWLFDPSYADFSVTHLPFLEGGLESIFNSHIHYDMESLTSSRSQLETPPHVVESDELISEYRRQEMLKWFRIFCQKPRSEQLSASLRHDGRGEFPTLSLDKFRDCLQEWWQHVAPRLPIVHYPTFNCNRGSVFLLMVMISLGAASLHGRQGHYADCLLFAEITIDNIRWEIVTQDEASPPVSLAVAQSLLLLESYEKMYSSRRFHERAHIYHTSTLTILRRGIIGRSGSESPPEVHAATETSPGMATDSRTSWIRWADTEAMHRVVFAAFRIDILHAMMFGHTADMAPHEIRLPLPCDDSLWTASTPEAARQLESNLRMYGVKPVPFLDGLKRALHGKEVPTTSFGRMIIMSGLLSVGWHLSHRETHLKWLDLTAPSGESQETWKQTLLKAFDNWKDGFDAAQGTSKSPALADQGAQRTGFDMQSAAVLYHLAHMSLQTTSTLQQQARVDIIGFQIFAGSRRVLGRKVSARDRANVHLRMEGWAYLPATRHAVLHAFKLLHRVLVGPRRIHATEWDRNQNEKHGVSLPPMEAQTYSIQKETEWMMYYATLCIWSFVMALKRRNHSQHDSHPYHEPVPSHHQASSSFLNRWPPKPTSVNYGRVVEYLTSVAKLPELSEPVIGTLADGLPDLLDTLRSILSEAHPELLQEAHERLKVCKELLLARQAEVIAVPA